MVDARDFAARKVLRYTNDIHPGLIILRAVKRAQIPVVKEPVRLLMDGKKPDRATLIPWPRGSS